MALAMQHRFRVQHNEKAIETYTQEEAIEIARRLVLESGGEIFVHDSEGKPKARVFLYEGKAYVDYYLNERIAMCEIIVHGKPRIASARIMVQSILELLAEDVPIETIIADEYFPTITREDVLACIAYAGSLITPEHPS